jgi:hypothetical protein
MAEIVSVPEGYREPASLMVRPLRNNIVIVGGSKVMQEVATGAPTDSGSGQAALPQLASPRPGHGRVIPDKRAAWLIDQSSDCDS